MINNKAYSVFSIELKNEENFANFYKFCGQLALESKEINENDLKKLFTLIIELKNNILELLDHVSGMARSKK